MITIFSIPKPFKGEMDVIQRNSIKSWILLDPNVEVILFGDEIGIEEVAEEFNIRQEKSILKNKFGTPFINYVFKKAQEISKYEILCYVNCDIIFMNDFIKTIKYILSIWKKRQFLIVGQRTDVDLKEPLDFSRPNLQDILFQLVKKNGKPRLHPGIDYFCFRKNSFKNLPPFLVGRPKWDNFMIWYAISFKIPIIDATSSILAIHQNHDYSHLHEENKGLWDTEEGKYNVKLYNLTTEESGINYNVKHANYTICNSKIQHARKGEYLRNLIKRFPLFIDSKKVFIKILAKLIRKIFIIYYDNYSKFFFCKILNCFIYFFILWFSKIFHKSKNENY